MIEFKPERISAHDWDERINLIPDKYKSECAFLRSIIPGGVKYLFSPIEYSCRGDALLSRLKFDSGLASLRLWAFLFSEKERLFLAKENGWKIFAAMKDLGQVPIISYAFPNTLTFYADELWWAPCFAEEEHLLDVAEELGAGKELCYIRAALGAYKTLDYFPKPDLSIAGVGSCCDDFSAVMQLIEWQGNPIHWWEIPTRFDCGPTLKTTKFNESFSGKSQYQESAVKFLIKQFEGIVSTLEDVCGRKITDVDLSRSLHQFNLLRSKVQKLRDLVYGNERPPLPGLEMFLTEFVAIHSCSEPDESLKVLDDLIQMVESRIEKKESPFTAEKPLRVFWATPPTDAALVTLLEDLGGCIAGTEYFISHAFYQLDENKSPLEAIAENYMDDPMIGTSDFRARRIINEAKKYNAEGILITGIFGASHCAYEEKVIADKVREELGIPVLSFDVPFTPGKLSEQVVSRMQGFMEILRLNRGENIPAEPDKRQYRNVPDETDPFEYFRNSMSYEVDYTRLEQKKGRGIVGIYCEYTPRDLIMAAGAIPVCLCGASQRTIAPAESVLPANLCPLIKSSYGYILTNRCPFYLISDLIVAETTCDGKKKMFELISERKNTHILELTQKADTIQAFIHWFDEVKTLKRKLELYYNIEVTDAKLTEAIVKMNKERSLLLKAFNLGRFKPAIVSGKELSMLRYRVAGSQEHLRMINLFIEKVENRAKSGYIFGEQGAPRVLLTGCPTAQGSEKVIEVIEECGGIVSVQESCSGVKPLYELVSTEGDPLEAIARKHFNLPCSCMTPNKGRRELIAKLIKEFQIDLVIDLVWHACHTYNVESFIIDKFVREEMNLPYLKIESDYSSSDKEQIKVRIQTAMELRAISR